MRDSLTKRHSARAHELFICWGLILLLSFSARSAKPSEGPSFPRIANVYGTAFTKDGTRFHGDDRTLKEAARYDLLVGVQRRQRNDPEGKMFRRHLEELKRINPHLIALHFACSAPYTHIAPPEEALAARQPGQIAPWLLQTDGRPIAGWPGTYMLNMAAPGVVDWLAHQTVPAVQQIGYDGVFIDCLGPHFDSWACEIATGKSYTVDFNADGEDDDREELKEVWTKAKTALARRTRELIGAEAVFMANQAGPATYDQLNGIYLEDYIDAILDRGMSWENVLEKYLHWTETPRQPNITVLGCGSAVEPRLTMTGPAGVVERDGNRVLRDGHGMAILIGPKGTIESLCSGEQELIDSIAPVIVTDDKWRNFDTGNLQHQVGPDGSVTLTGQRTHGQ